MVAAAAAWAGRQRDARRDPGRPPIRALRLASGLATRCSSTSSPRASGSARYQPLPDNPALGGPLDAVHATARLPRLDPAEPFDGPGVSGWLRAVVRVDG